MVSTMKAHSFSKPDKKLLTRLGVEIRRLRKKKKLTIEEFADRCGLHSKYIQTIEAGRRNISISVFIKLSKALDISAIKLLNYLQ